MGANVAVSCNPPIGDESDLRSICGQRRPQNWGNEMYTLGYLLLAALLLGAVTTVVDSVLGTVQLSGIIKKIPIIGSNWGLIACNSRPPLKGTLEPAGASRRVLHLSHSIQFQLVFPHGHRPSGLQCVST